MSSRKQRWQNYRSKLPLHSRFILSFSIDRLYAIRNDYAAKYIRGSGYEIGAQNSPLACRNANQVTFIDYLSRKESSQKYNIPENDCVEVNIIADANNLTDIPSNSASFIIANHVLEHSPNPIGALLGWLRILRDDGVLFLTLPNYKSNEFDFEKKPASIAHFLKDYEKALNNEDISTEHIFEHIKLIDGIDPTNKEIFEKRYNQIVASKLHTHYHVFDEENILNLLAVIHKHFPIRVLNSFYFDNSLEFLFIIKKVRLGNNKPLKMNKNRLFNCAILLKHITLFLYNRFLFKRKQP